MSMERRRRQTDEVLYELNHLGEDEDAYIEAERERRQERLRHDIDRHVLRAGIIGSGEIPDETRRGLDKIIDKHAVIESRRKRIVDTSNNHLKHVNYKRTTKERDDEMESQKQYVEGGTKIYPTPPSTPKDRRRSLGITAKQQNARTKFTELNRTVNITDKDYAESTSLNPDELRAQRYNPKSPLAREVPFGKNMDISSTIKARNKALGALSKSIKLQKAIKPSKPNQRARIRIIKARLDRKLGEARYSKQIKTKFAHDYTPDDVGEFINSPEQRARALHLVDLVQKNRKLQEFMNSPEGSVANRLYVNKGIKMNPKKWLEKTRRQEAKQRLAAPIIQETGEGVTFRKVRPTTPDIQTFGDYKVPMHPTNAFLIRPNNPDNFMNIVKELRGSQNTHVRRLSHGTTKQTSIRKSDVEGLPVGGMQLRHHAEVLAANGQTLKRGDILFRRVGAEPKDRYTYGAVGDTYYIENEIFNAKPFTVSRSTRQASWLPNDPADPDYAVKEYESGTDLLEDKYTKNNKPFRYREQKYTSNDTGNIIDETPNIPASRVIGTQSDNPVSPPISNVSTESEFAFKLNNHYNISKRKPVGFDATGNVVFADDEYIPSEAGNSFNPYQPVFSPKDLNPSEYKTNTEEDWDLDALSESGGQDWNPTTHTTQIDSTLQKIHMLLEESENPALLGEQRQKKRMEAKVMLHQYMPLGDNDPDRVLDFIRDNNITRWSPEVYSFSRVNAEKYSKQKNAFLNPNTTRQKWMRFIYRGKDECDICKQFDGKVYRVDDENRPVIPRLEEWSGTGPVTHPNCRCMWAKTFSEESLSNQEKRQIPIFSFKVSKTRDELITHALKRHAEGADKESVFEELVDNHGVSGLMARQIVESIKWKTAKQRVAGEDDVENIKRKQKIRRMRKKIAKPTILNAKINIMRSKITNMQKTNTFGQHSVIDQEGNILEKSGYDHFDMARDYFGLNTKENNNRPEISDHHIHKMLADNNWIRVQNFTRSKNPHLSIHAATPITPQQAKTLLQLHEENPNTDIGYFIGPTVETAINGSVPSMKQVLMESRKAFRTRVAKAQESIALFKKQKLGPQHEEGFGFDPRHGDFVTPQSARERYGKTGVSLHFIATTDNLGPVENILEALDEIGEQHFIGGWKSSTGFKTDAAYVLNTNDPQEVILHLKRYNQEASYSIGPSGNTFFIRNPYFIKH